MDRMDLEQNYQNINRLSWNNRTEVHLKSAFYDIDGFLKGNTSLKNIELDLLGDLKGKSILHLQCHFGQDSIALSRLGAEVTGIDLADKAVENARILAQKAGTDTRFICCDIYDLPRHLDQKFDLVFTSYGVIGWLPDLQRWAGIVSHFLKPQGRFVLVEFHPAVWMFSDDFKNIAYDYFNTGPIIENLSGSYADKTNENTYETITWNHSLADVINNLIGEGLSINALDEFDYSPYDCFQDMVASSPGKYRIRHLKNKIPMVYSILATKN